MAGPVVAGAVLVESPDQVFDSRITDSKKITPKKREELAKEIKAHFRTSVGQASPAEIDQINIFQASFLAMRRAIEQLSVSNGFVLVDGKFKIPDLVGFQQLALIKGDLRAQPIGAASILAKVYRDQMMVHLAQDHPQYGFEVHKGYATLAHRKAIQKVGASEWHRKSFRGTQATGL